MPASPAPRSLLWLWYPAFFLMAARGQDALFSSLSLDQSTAAQAAHVAGQSRLGPVQFALGAFAGASYNDNISGSDFNPGSDVIWSEGMNLNLLWPVTGQSAVQFGASLGYLEYQRHPSDSGLQINPDSALTYAISLDQVTVTFFDQFSYVREVQTQAALANIAALPLLNNNLGFRTEWDPGHWVLLGSYSHDDNLSDHAHDYVNQSSEYFFGRAGWRFAENTQAGVEASDSWSRYQILTQNNNQNVSVGGYLDWSVRPGLQLALRGGPVFYHAQAGADGGNSSLNSYYVSLTASHQITDFLSQSLDVERSLQSGLNLGGSYYEQLSVNYALAWALTQRISIGPTASYVDGRQPLDQNYALFPNPAAVPVIVNEDYQQYGAGLQISWRCSDHLTADFNFNHWLRDSNLPGRNYSDNSVSFQINYSF